MWKYSISVLQNAQKSAGQGPVQFNSCFERRLDGMTSQSPFQLKLICQSRTGLIYLIVKLDFSVHGRLNSEGKRRKLITP